MTSSDLKLSRIWIHSRKLDYEVHFQDLEIFELTLIEGCGVYPQSHKGGKVKKEVVGSFYLVFFQAVSINGRRQDF